MSWPLQEAYDAYKQHFENSPAAVLRDCIDIIPAGEPISIDEVESAADIMVRFCTGGMSLGAISRETHETIAVAMNRIGGEQPTKCIPTHQSPTQTFLWFCHGLSSACFVSAARLCHAVSCRCSASPSCFIVDCLKVTLQGLDMLPEVDKALAGHA